MPGCELLDICPFINGSMYEMAERYKEQYCKGEYAWCGRYMAFKALENELERKKHVHTGKGIQCIRK